MYRHSQQQWAHGELALSDWCENAGITWHLVCSTWTASVDQFTSSIGPYGEKGTVIWFPLSSAQTSVTKNFNREDALLSCAIAKSSNRVNICDGKAEGMVWISHRKQEDRVGRKEDSWGDQDRKNNFDKKHQTYKLVIATLIKLNQIKCSQWRREEEAEGKVETSQHLLTTSK